MSCEDPKMRRFSFRCSACKVITVVDFTDPKEIVEVLDCEFDLECPCGDLAKLLVS